MGLIRETANRQEVGEYEVKVGVEWNKAERLQIWTTDGFRSSYTASTIPLAQPRSAGRVGRV